MRDPALKILMSNSQEDLHQYTNYTQNDVAYPQSNKAILALRRGTSSQACPYNGNKVAL